MNILSKFKDYYDYLNDPKDKAHTFVRHIPSDTSKEFQDMTAFILKHSTLKDLPYEFYISNDKFMASLRVNIFYFCGLLYPYFVMSHAKCEPGNIHKQTHCHFLFDVDSAIDLYKAADAWNTNSKTPKSVITYISSKRFLQNHQLETVKRFFKDIYSNFKFLESFSKKFKVPYFVMSPIPRYLLVNPKLSEIDFPKLMPPEQAYQMIEMYLFNTMMVETTKPVPVGNDKVIAASKGFTSKYSFRKEPRKVK